MKNSVAVSIIGGLLVIVILFIAWWAADPRLTSEAAVGLVAQTLLSGDYEYAIEIGALADLQILGSEQLGISSVSCAIDGDTVFVAVSNVVYLYFPSSNSSCLVRLPLNFHPHVMVGLTSTSMSTFVVYTDAASTRSLGCQFDGLGESMEEWVRLADARTDGLDWYAEPTEGGKRIGISSSLQRDFHLELVVERPVELRFDLRIAPLDSRRLVSLHTVRELKCDSSFTLDLNEEAEVFLGEICRSLVRSVSLPDAKRDWNERVYDFVSKYDRSHDG